MKEEIFRLLDDETRIVVLPTQRSVRHTLALYCRERKTSVPASRALSFDDFSRLFDEDVGDREGADSLARSVFASQFMKTEGQKLKSLYNSDHSESRERTASFIASILSQLGGSLDSIARKDVASDLALLKSSYSAFLDRYGFYEKGWLGKSASAFRGDRTKTYVLVCPEAEVNMMRLLETVGEQSFISTLNAPQMPIPQFRLYDNERAELLSLFDSLEDLRDRGIPQEDIILSTPDVDRLRPYLEEEAQKRGFPLSFERDAKVLETKVGRYLSLITSLYSESFSFQTLERLLLDTSLPYREEIMSENRHLLARMVDLSISDDSAHDLVSRLHDQAAERHFKTLRTHVRAIVEEKDAEKVFASLQSLSSWLFGQDQFRNDGSDREVYSFILDRYRAFSALLERLDSPIERIWPTFISALSKVDYISQHRKSGIRVYQWGHDYMMHVPYRFVFALSDTNCSRQEADWSFLEDSELVTRQKWDAGEGHLNALFASADNLSISGSRESYNGATMAPFFFTRNNRVSERRREGGRSLVDCQARSLVNVSSCLPLDDSKRLDGTLRTEAFVPSKGFSYSFVSTYSSCPFRSAMGTLAHIRDRNWDVQAYDPRLTGTMLHNVLEAFLEKRKGTALKPDETAVYEEEITGLLDAELAKTGLSAYLASHIRAVYLDGLKSFPGELLHHYGGSPVIVRGTEFETSALGLYGRIDALFDYPEGTILVDFKSRNVTQAQEYQLLMYRKMLISQDYDVDPLDLLYYRIGLEADRFVPEAPLRRKTKKEPEARLDDERFEAKTAQMDQAIEETARSTGDGIWKTTDDYSACTGCAFRSVCRRRYFTR